MKRGLIAVVLILGAAGVAYPPTSPFTLARANVRYLQGDVAGARVYWEHVAEGWQSTSVRSLAAERAAQASLSLGEPARAVHWYRRAITLDPSDAPRLEAALADLYQHHFDDPERAGFAFLRASQASPDSALLVKAARAFGRAEAWADAASAWSAALPHLDDPDRAEAQAALLRAERHLDQSGDE